MADPQRETAVRLRWHVVAGDHPSAAERALFARLIGNFLGRTGSAIDGLAETLRAGDPQPVETQAHKLSSSAANLGATTLAALFVDVENQARRGHLPRLDPVVRTIRAEYDLVTPVLVLLAQELLAPSTRAYERG